MTESDERVGLRRKYMGDWDFNGGKPKSGVKAL